MEISLLAILLSIAALGLNVMLIAFWNENKKEIKCQKKDNELMYVKKHKNDNDIAKIQSDMSDVANAIIKLRKEVDNKSFQNKDNKKDVKTSKYRVTFETAHWHGGIPIRYHPQYEVDCEIGDVVSVANKAQNAFDSHPDNVELEREIVKIELLGK
ncbi:hypothetical protein [Mammaliicoccus lentus]|uniref:hypothetical protein n=1 Tax=Mammaliicoccus lentus TaxID=42858 RepID=UPI00374FBC9D